MLGQYLRGKNAPFIVSLCVHVSLLVPLLFWQMGVHSKQIDAVLETMFEADRPPEEFTRELNLDTQIAEDTNVISSGVMNAVASSGGGGGGGVGGGGGGGSGGGGGGGQGKIEGSDVFQD